MHNLDTISVSYVYLRYWPITSL